MGRVTSFFTKRYIWVSGRGVVLGTCSSKLANFLKLLKITAKSFTNTCDGVQFCKVSCFQPAVLPEKWNPSQVFSKEFAKILKPGSKKFSITISQNASICVLPLLSNYYDCFWNFFFCETAREVMQQTHMLIDRNY